MSAVLLIGPLVGSPSGSTLSYSAFLADVDSSKVKTVTIGSDGSLTGQLKDGTNFESRVSTAVDDGGLVNRLTSHEVEIKAAQSGGGFGAVLISLLPMVLFVGLFLYLGKRGSQQLGGLGGVLGAGRSRTKVIEQDRPATRFTDVAGYDGVKQEISEIIDFLKAPERYAKAGAVGPRGVLMIGPPGTGKTLIARAVAGEAEVPFLVVTGSSFVEMFVGVGAARVRDLFADARKRAPAIIFIDEIDAIGGRRGTVGFGSNDEREQTLNQLLSEMDGFDTSVGLVVLAATNRPEVLDPALLRAGRFDRQITVPLPKQDERAAILAVHSKGKTLGPDTDLDVVARGTPGFSGADLANLVNEAAINAVRQERTVITAADFETARDRIILGRREGSNVLLPDEKRAVAVHEAGHALVAVLLPEADPVAKVTILPAGVTLGVTEQLPEAERHLYSETYLLSSLAVRMGGRAAELIVFGHGSTGAANDLAGATELATRMVREFGLSAKMGPVGYAIGHSQFLGHDGVEIGQRAYSEDTQRVIDAEVARLLHAAENTALELLAAHRGELDSLTALLLVRETVDGSDVQAIIAGVGPGVDPIVLEGQGR